MSPITGCAWTVPVWLDPDNNRVEEEAGFCSGLCYRCNTKTGRQQGTLPSVAENWESDSYAYPYIKKYILKQLAESHYINANYVLWDTAPTLGHFLIHRCYTQTIYLVSHNHIF